MPQFARPISDISFSGGWSASGPGTFFSKMDEVVANDAVDYATANVFLGSEDLIVGLTALTDPASSTGHTMRVRYRVSGTPAAGIVLYQGAVPIASLSLFDTSGSWVTDTYALSGTECDAITNYGDLRFGLSVSDFAAGAVVDFTWAELQVPDLPQLMAQVCM